MVFPNPVSEILTIQVTDSIQFEKAIIYSVLGKQILISSEKIIDVSSLSQGIYFVLVDTDKGTITKKIVKE